MIYKAISRISNALYQYTTRIIITYERLPSPFNYDFLVIASLYTLVHFITSVTERIEMIVNSA